MGLTPVLDYILVRKTEEQAPSGLYIPAPVDPTAPRHAEVVAVGPGRPSEYSGAMIEYRYRHRTTLPNGDVHHETATAAGSPVSVGNTIVMHGGAGTKVMVDGAELWAILPRDLIGVVSA